MKPHTVFRKIAPVHIGHNNGRFFAFRQSKPFPENFQEARRGPAEEERVTVFSNLLSCLAHIALTTIIDITAAQLALVVAVYEWS